MRMDMQKFLEEAGLKESLNPGEIKQIHHISEKEGSSYTVVYDRKTDPSKIRVELRPGLTGNFPDKKELSRYDLWLQTPTFIEAEIQH